MEKKMRMKDVSSISPLGCIIEHRDCAFFFWVECLF